MPNCDFYATIDDHRLILDWLFSTDLVDVYELSSDFEKPLRKFEDSTSVLEQFTRKYDTGEPWHTTHLQIVLRNAGINFKPTYVKLDPKYCGGFKFRYSADGFGLIQLYLSVPGKKELKNSHTNHFSHDGAQPWIGVSTTESVLSKIDFKAISSFSSRLNRQIRKLAVAKIGGRILTRSAMDLWNLDYRLAPYEKGSVEVKALT